MTIAARYGELFQMSYITRDLDAAMAHCRETLGIEEFSTTEADIEVESFGKMRPLKIRAAMANIGRNQFEIRPEPLREHPHGPCGKQQKGEIQ